MQDTSNRLGGLSRLPPRPLFLVSARYREKNVENSGSYRVHNAEKLSSRH